ncbi:helix-turn-helix transcriptional regulator [Diaphorobacter sp. HDW4B]|uniref:helix-turn-helix domain-containing protein n=1 Tax=Diaphorobacter sp. HDW4B TaxID=2714925 RepID=UPI00140D7263|nr:helix-turn-helix transcriptional regulator [Diaphorobacter sp. HDW4B]QIL70019.1 helix-turn-helix transcriptional regulator [Diaphorobacter sp. HDW4B]
MTSPSLVHDFGIAVRQLRESRGWSQEMLAAHSDLHRTYVGEVERGLVTPSLVTLHKLACALDIRAADLLLRTDQIASLRNTQHLRLTAIAC